MTGVQTCALPILAQRLAALQVSAAGDDGAGVAVSAEGVVELDLHGFQVRAAVAALDALLHALSRTPSARLLKVITGAGNHSGPDGARIKPAVLRYLSARQLPHYALNRGCFLVSLPKGWYRL